MTIPFRFRTVRFGATVLLFITMGQLAHAQSDLDVFIGPRMERDEDLGRSLGSDDELFYTLRTVEEKKGRTGFIDGWSRETLSKVFSTPLEVPVVNAEVFSVHEVIVGDRGLQLFYSFHSREDGRVVLAMAALDQQGRMVGDAQELIEVPAAKKRTTQRFIVNHDNRSGMTLILNTDLVHPDNTFGWFEPVLQVITMDGEGKVRGNSPLTIGTTGHCIFRDFTADGNGNAYLRVSHFKGKKEECQNAVFTIPAGGGAGTRWCLPEPPKDLDYRDDNGFYYDHHGVVTYVAPLADPNQYEDVRGFALRGVVVQTFDEQSAQRTLDRTHLFVASYPAGQNNKPGEHEMSNCNIMDISFQPDGKLNFYGSESFAKVGSGGENSFWGLRLDLETGFEKPWGCGAQRQYAFYPNQESLFNFHVTQLGGVDHLLANEVRSNVGKACANMEDWNKQNANGDKTTPCYAVLSGDAEIGPRQRLTTDALGTTQYFRRVNYAPNEEEIISVTSDSGRYLVRLRSAKD
ncbi:MAG TPA: hypothetical protein PLL25_11800 [Flavobacteriales bacterium]|jgi:hypothetical protein|nr:hypothetical protein [Flavobacteriales bacterium]